MSENKNHQSEVPAPIGILQFENGSLITEQIDSLLNTLPVGITFIDENNTARYFNKPEKIFFVRTKSIIRKVQNCHPAKSLDAITKIVETFKSEKKSWAEFWINVSNHMINIRSFNLRDSNGKYLGNNPSSGRYNRHS